MSLCFVFFVCSEIFLGNTFKNWTKGYGVINIPDWIKFTSCNMSQNSLLIFISCKVFNLCIKMNWITGRGKQCLEGYTEKHVKIMTFLGVLKEFKMCS